MECPIATLQQRLLSSNASLILFSYLTADTLKKLACFHDFLSYCGIAPGIQERIAQLTDYEQQKGVTLYDAYFADRLSLTGSEQEGEELIQEEIVPFLESVTPFGYVLAATYEGLFGFLLADWYTEVRLSLVQSSTYDSDEEAYADLFQYVNDAQQAYTYVYTDFTTTEKICEIRFHGTTTKLIAHCKRMFSRQWHFKDIRLEWQE